jgi:hypothetical protein
VSATTAVCPTLAVFVSSHGFGHASRAYAVLEHLRHLEPKVQIELFTRVPRWFFDSLGPSLGFHQVDCDLGLVQTDAFEVDYKATIADLSGRLPFRPELIQDLVRRVIALGCHTVLCDIAPLGLAVAKEARLPSILLENFTWDWIYNGLSQQAPPLRNYAHLLQSHFMGADTHIQTEPVCHPVSDAYQVGPIARAFRTNVSETRKALSINKSDPLVFISMGGTRTGFPFLEQLKTRFPGVRFVISGATELIETDQNLTLLPVHCSLHHPDLVRAADLVIGKAGYSTIAEVHAAGTPFGCFVRADYPEMGPLVKFVEKEIPGKTLGPGQFANGQWLDALPELLEIGSIPRPSVTAAAECAALVRTHF